MNNKKGIRFEVGTRVRFIPSKVAALGESVKKMAKDRTIVVVGKVVRGDDEYNHYFKDIKSYYFGYELEPVAKPLIIIKVRGK